MDYWKIFLILGLFVLISLGTATFVNNENFFNFGEIFSLNNQNSMSGLANSSWPMENHDKQRTGASDVVGPQTNNTKWSFDLGTLIGSSPSIGSDGTIYILATGNTTNDTNNSLEFNQYFLYAINPNGTLKWKTNYILNTGHVAPTITEDGTIYIGGLDCLYAIDPNGKLKWQYAQETSEVNIGSDGTVYFTNGAKCYAINPNGTLNWESEDLGAHDTPTIGSDGTIYFVSADYLYAFQPNGKLKWKSSIGGSIMNTGPNSPTIGPDGTIYVTTGSFSEQNHGGYDFYAFNPDGSTKWIFTSGSSPYGGYESYDGTPSIGLYGTIYTSVTLSSTGFIYAINPNGTAKWRYETENQCPIDSPIITDPDGTIYFISDKIYALNPDKTIKWQSYINNPGALGSLAIGSDGTLYATTETSSYLYAIGP